MFACTSLSPSYTHSLSLSLSSLNITTIPSRNSSFILFSLICSLLLSPPSSNFLLLQARKYFTLTCTSLSLSPSLSLPPFLSLVIFVQSVFAQALSLYVSAPTPSSPPLSLSLSQPHSPLGAPTHML